MSNQPQGNQGQGQLIRMIRLSPDSDIGIISAGITAKVVDVGPLDQIAHALETGSEFNVPNNNKRAEFWLTVALGQPSVIGQLHVEEINLRMVLSCSSYELIEKFARQKAERAAQASPVLVVPG